MRKIDDYVKLLHERFPNIWRCADSKKWLYFKDQNVLSNDWLRADINSKKSNIGGKHVLENWVNNLKIGDLIVVMDKYNYFGLCIALSEYEYGVNDRNFDGLTKPCINVNYLHKLDNPVPHKFDVTANVPASFFRLNGMSFSELKTFDFIEKNYPEALDKLDEYFNNLKEQKLVMENTAKQSLNRILFGPPGTGKTFHSISHAVAIVEGKKVEDLIKERESKIRLTESLTVKERYDRYVDQGFITFCTFHQSMGYEDFIEGIKPSLFENRVIYTEEPGLFKKICQKASLQNIESNFSESYKKLLQVIDENDGSLVLKTLKHNKEFTVYRNSKDNLRFHANTEKAYEGVIRKEIIEGYLESGIAEDWASYTKSVAEYLKNNLGYKPSSKREKRNFVLIIDEINRGNVSQIFGELITLIEDDKRLGKDEALKIRLPYSGDDFGVPPNLYIIGTMNTADRSVEALDTALRRRFTFVPMLPEETKLKPTSDGIDLPKMLKTLNSRLKILKDADHTIGHAWLMSVSDADSLSKAFINKILPLLQEYFYNDYEKLGMLLGEKFFKKPTTVDDKSFAKFFGSSLSSQYENAEQYQLEDVDKLTKDVFVSIYQ